MLNYNNYETIDITEGETDIIHISDDFLLNSNEIHYNDNHIYVSSISFTILGSGAIARDDACKRNEEMTESALIEVSK